MVYNISMKELSTARNVFFVLILFIIAVPVFTQSTGSEPSAVVIYADGEGFDVIHEGESTYFDINSSDNIEGVELFSGDIINTSAGTFIEIQLTPSENLVKVSENTSFTVKETDKSGGGSFELNYGRVRAKVVKLFGLEKFRISGPTMVAGVRGTDFGYDIIADRASSGEQISSVYCFEGEVAVEAIPTAEESSLEVSKPVIIRADEMVNVVKNEESLEIKLNTEPLSTEIRTFWNENDFKGEVIKQPVPVDTSSMISDKTDDMSEKLKLRKENFKNAAVWTGSAGIIMEAAGVLLFFSNDIFPGSISFDSSALETALFTSGGIMLGSSFFSIIGYLSSGK